MISDPDSVWVKQREPFYFLYPSNEDTSLSKILHQIEHAKIQPLDRWNIEVDEGDIKLPLNVINNYISMGVDAEACYKFHTERGKNKLFIIFK